MKTVLTTFNSKYIHSSLALASIQTYAAQQGMATKVLEFSLQTPVLSALSDIFAEQPEVVGIAVHIWNRQLAFALARLVKQVLPETVLVLGGPEVSFTVEQVFAELLEVDFIVQGEGEEVLVHLLQQLVLGKDGKGVPGAAWQQTKGAVQLEGGPQIISDLSTLVFPYDFATAALEHKIVYYETTRGCPFSCAYCLSGVSRNVRRKPLEPVFADLHKFISANVKQVKFVDRTYNLDKQHYLPIMQWLAAQDTQTNFHFEIKADTLDEEVLDFLATVPKGRFQFEIGIQSTHEQTLAASGRQQDWDKLHSVVAKLRSFGNIHLHLDLIVGLPYETAEIFAFSFNQVYNLKPHMLQIGFLKLLQGSSLARSAHSYGYRFMPEPPYEVLQNNFISYAELRKLKLLEEVFEQTYNSGKFTNTLDYIMKLYNNDAYRFYSELSAWWEQNGLFSLGHNARAVAQYLATFCQQRRSNKECRQLLDCLKLDIITLHDKNFRPAWLCWQTTGLGTPSERFWRNEKLVAQYLPGYKFTNWREINNNYQIEIFDHYFMGTVLERPQALLFSKIEGSYQFLADQDFS